MQLVSLRLGMVVLASLCWLGCGSSGSPGGGGGGGGGGQKSFPSQPMWQPSGSRVTWNGFSFIVPQGMVGTDRTDSFEMTDPACILIASGPLAATGDLAQQALELLVSGFSGLGYQLMDDTLNDADILSFRTQGRSAGGWEYVELRAQLLRSGSSGDERGHIMLVRAGSQVFPIFGYSPTSVGCTQLMSDNGAGFVGELRWRELEFSLDFPSATKDDAALASAIIGHWSYFQGVSAQEYVFAANGRYQHWGGLGQVHDVSPTEYEIVTSVFAGDGSYHVKGNVVALFPDGRDAESMLFRIYEKHSAYPTTTTTGKFGLMRKDSAGAYEVPLERVR